MKKLTTILIVLSAALVASAQSGGAFDLKQSVVGGTGGSSAGGKFSVDSTGGQPFFGSPAHDPPFAMTIGFWNFSPLAPTAAQASVSGRVTSARGNGVLNVRVTLTSQTGEVRTSLTGPFGYYRFQNVLTGETYLLTVSSKRFVFSQPTRVLNVRDEISDADFIADN